MRPGASRVHVTRRGGGRRTKFHEPKDRNPDQLNPNATGVGIAPKQVEEDAIVGR